MKKSIIQIITTILMLTLGFANGAVREVNGIAAIVNNDIITNNQVMEQVNIMKDQLQQQKQAVPAEAVLKKQILAQLIDQQLQIQVAKRVGVKVTDAEVNQTIASIAAQNNMSPAVFKEQVVKQGYNYQEYRKQIRRQIALNAVQHGVLGKKVVVTPEETKQSLAQIKNHMQSGPAYHLQAILVPLSLSSTPDQMSAAEQQAEKIVAAAKQGTAFSNIMTSTAQPLQGGDMGWKQLTQLPPNFAAGLAAATPNSIVGPIQTGDGFYILKVVEIHNSTFDHTVTLNHVRHILLKPSQLETASQLKARLELVRDRIAKGENFENLAEQYSQDTNTSNKGGDLGWISSDSVPVDFASVMDNLPLNHVSQAIQTHDGWELIQVLARKKIDNSNAFLENQAKQMVFQHKLMQEVQNWVKQLRTEAYIKIT